MQVHSRREWGSLSLEGKGQLEWKMVAWIPVRILHETEVSFCIQNKLYPSILHLKIEQIPIAMFCVGTQ